MEVYIRFRPLRQENFFARIFSSEFFCANFFEATLGWRSERPPARLINRFDAAKGS